jgi:aspartate-semialdehyde dehydrogenase
LKPKNPAGFRLGIVNPLTLVGNEIKTVLRDRSFPSAKVTLLDSTGKAAGALTDVGDEPAVVAAVSDIELEDLDLVFFCGPPSGITTGSSAIAKTNSSPSTSRSRRASKKATSPSRV